MRMNEQIAREAAERMNLPGVIWHCKEVEQIILAAIREAMRVEWVDEPPTHAGLWQHRFSDEHTRVGRNVVLRDGVLCCEFGGEFLTVDSIGGQWSNKPITEPE